MFLRPRCDQARCWVQVPLMPDSAPAGVQDEAHDKEISRLNHRAFDLAVYASQWKSPATTQDSLPAAGPALPDGIGYPLGSNERFHILRWFSFPELLGTRTQLVIDSSCVPVSAPWCASLRSNAFSMNILAGGVTGIPKSPAGGNTSWCTATVRQCLS